MDPTAASHHGQSGYTTMIDSNDGIVADDVIFCIDAHTSAADTDQYPDQYTQPEITPETLGTLVTALTELDRDRMAGLVETKQRQLEDNPDSPLYFTAVGLSDIATMLTLGIAKSQFTNEFDVTYAISEFGRAVRESCEPPYLAERYEKIDYPKVRPTGDKVFIDPFKVIGGQQDVVFTDNQGNDVESDAGSQ